jgi:hypothetical protein
MRRFGGVGIVRSVVVLLCLVLVLVAGTAATLHTHPGGVGSSAADACSLCAVAHLSAIPVSVAATPLAADPVTALLPQPAVAIRATLFHFSRYVRPPPASTPRS